MQNSSLIRTAILLCSSCVTVTDLDSGREATRWSSIEQSNPTGSIAENLVSEAEATGLARAFATARFGWGTTAIASAEVQLDDRTGAPSIYVLRFESGGWVLVSADKRHSPILAYSDSSTFDVVDLASKKAPEGVRGFMLRAHEQTHDIRVGVAPPVSSAQAFARLTTRLQTSMGQGSDPTTNWVVSGPDNCTGSYVHTYELNFPALWHQSCGFNDAAPIIAGGPCGHAAAGCGAVAIGQVMRYYAYPRTIDWGSIADVTATPGAAQLLRSIGDQLGTRWGADASGASLEASEAVLEQGFGYSRSASYTETFWGVMPDEAKAGRPVLMKGARDCDFLGFQTCEGHIWVVTGVYDSYDCGSGTGGRHYKMNWGWGGPFNGWYIDGQLNPINRNYNNFQGVIIGIHP